MYLPDLLYITTSIVVLLLVANKGNNETNSINATIYTRFAQTIASVSSFHARNFSITGDAESLQLWKDVLYKIDPTRSKTLQKGLRWENANIHLLESRDIIQWNNSLPILKDLLWDQIVVVNAKQGKTESDSKIERQTFFETDKIIIPTFTTILSPKVSNNQPSLIFSNNYTQNVLDYGTEISKISVRNTAATLHDRENSIVTVNILYTIMVLAVISRFQIKKPTRLSQKSRVPKLKKTGVPRRGL